MLNNSTNDRLISYLDGELTPNEATQLEAEIAQSEELKEALQQLKITQYGVKYWGIQNQVKTIHQQHLANKNLNQVTTIGKKKTNWLLYVASAAAAAILVFFILNTQSASVSADDLYANNFRKYDISNTRGTTTANNIKQQFAQQQYEGIITQFTNNSTPGIEDQFFAALSYRELKQFNNSIPLLQNIIETNKKQNTILYKDDAEYYLGMTYLQQKDIAKALQILGPIAENKQHLYSDVINTKFINSLKKLIK